MIRHTVAFTLKHPHGSAAETAFLDAAKILAAIPGVEKFEQLRQVSAKNAYRFGFSMDEFLKEQRVAGKLSCILACKQNPGLVPKRKQATRLKPYDRNVAVEERL